MQISSISPLPPGCCLHLRQPFSAQIPTPTTVTNTRRPTTSLFGSTNKHPQIQCNTNTDIFTTSDLQDDNNLTYANGALLLDEIYSFLGNNNKRDQNQEPPKQEKSESSNNKVQSGISSNMWWWQKVKATIGQRFNLEGISSALAVITRDRHLALPHIYVKDIRWIDWVELEKRGFQGVVFDKDNTITAPYSLSVWPPLESSLDCCKSVFGDNVAIFSNSAGLLQYDGDGSKARAVEDSTGIHVIRHGVKKPGGSADDIENYFGCSTSALILVGDRHFTDLVYGNRNGFLTILTEPLSLFEEPFIVKQVRKLEASLANYWHRKGLKPKAHSLQSEAMMCVKVPRPPPL